MSHLRTHQHRDDLTGEHVLGDAGQAILFLVFLSVWITDVFIFRYSTLINDYIPFFTVRLPLAIIVLLLSAFLAWNGMMIVFFKASDKTAVIRKGVFGVVRHPIYIGEALLYLGLLLLNISLAALTVWIVIIGFLHYISRYEEKALLERFGDDYEQYMKDVPMYFPKIFKRHMKKL